MKISDLKIVITGAASGMGRHFTKRLLDEGAMVSAWDIDGDALNGLLDQHPDAPLHIARVDVTQEAGVRAAMDDAWSRFGVINGLVNNAGVFRDSLLVKRDHQSGAVKLMSLEQWQRVIDIDLTGPFLCTRELSARLVS